MAILDEMLTAAAGAAGGFWNTIESDVTAFAESLVRDSVQLKTDYTVGNISSDDLKTGLQMLNDYNSIIGNYADLAAKAAAQAAIYAAIDALWRAITTAARRG